MHETLKEVNMLAADVERLFQRLASEGAECAGDSAEKLRAMLRELRGRLEHFERHAGREIGRKVRDADRYVRDHPWQTLGLAAALAFVAGALLMRRD